MCLVYRTGIDLNMNKKVFAALAAVLCGLATPAALAQAFPSHPVKIVVPAAAGGVGDVFVRKLSDAMSKGLGQPVVVDNRPGANGFIAAEAVARAAELPELPARGVIRQFPLDGDSGRALFGIVEGELVARKRQPHAGQAEGIAPAALDDDWAAPPLPISYDFTRSPMTSVAAQRPTNA